MVYGRRHLLGMQSLLGISWLSLSRTRLSRITAYLEVKILSLLKHENLTTGKKILWKKGAISPLFHNIVNISLTSRVQLHIYLLNVVNRISFSPILQVWYVEVRISRSISESLLEFERTIVDCTSKVHSLRRLQKLNTFSTFRTRLFINRVQTYKMVQTYNWITNFKSLNCIRSIN